VIKSFIQPAPGHSQRPFANSPISFPEHARSQVKGGYSSGEIELIQACDWLTADSTLDFQREFYISTHAWQVAKYKQSIWNFSSKIWYFLHWNRLKTTRNYGGNMYESFALTGIQLHEKYKENFDVSSEGASTCGVSVCIHRTWPFILPYLTLRIP
jgi:hypothetical protein